MTINVETKISKFSISTKFQLRPIPLEKTEEIPNFFFSPLLLLNNSSCQKICVKFKKKNQFIQSNYHLHRNAFNISGFNLAGG